MAIDLTLDDLVLVQEVLEYHPGMSFLLGALKAAELEYPVASRAELDRLLNTEGESVLVPGGSLVNGTLSELVSDYCFPIPDRATLLCVLGSVVSRYQAEFEQTASLRRRDLAPEILAGHLPESPPISGLAGMGLLSRTDEGVR